MKDEESEKVEANKEEEKATKDCPEGEKDDVTQEAAAAEALGGEAQQDGEDQVMKKPQ